MAGKEPLESQLQKALAEIGRLREENARLRALLNRSNEQGPQKGLGVVTQLRLPVESVSPEALSQPPDQGLPSGSLQPPLLLNIPELSALELVTNNSPAELKIAKFRSLFRGREDVYARRWEKKDGRSGYSPACRNEWVRGLCKKPRANCGYCEHREFLPITDQVIHDHLCGKHTIGVYPLLGDETCWFLAADFDKATWQEDARVFLQACGEMGIPAALERSRSGNGGHVWVFFEGPVPVSQARKLGCAILTRAMEGRYQVGLDSYDRLFPNQDTMPKGGFGNLIAMPLQRGPRDKGNSVFLDQDFKPYPDQWEFLSRVQRMSVEDLERIVAEATRAGSIIGVRGSLTDVEGDEDPWTLPPSRRKPEKPITGPLPESVRVVRSNLVYIEKQGLPQALINRLVRLAAFQNPEFYKAQALRMPTFGKPRVIGCAEDYARHIGLPRGCLDEVLDLFKAHGIRVEMTDERLKGVPIDVTFGGGTPALAASGCRSVVGMRYRCSGRHYRLRQDRGGRMAHRRTKGQHAGDCSSAAIARPVARKVGCVSGPTSQSYRTDWWWQG